MDLSDLFDSKAWLSLLTPASSLLIRYVSFLCVAFGLLVSGPFIVLIIFDIILWIWRCSRCSRGQPQAEEEYHNTSHSAQMATTSGAIIIDDGSNDPLRLRRH